MSTAPPPISPGTPGPVARRWDFGDWAPLITLGVLILFFGILTDNFFTLGTLSNVLSQGSVLAIVSVGLTFVLLCGEIDLSVGMVAVWTACLCCVMWESDWAAGRGGETHANVSGIMLDPDNRSQLVPASVGETHANVSGIMLAPVIAIALLTSLALGLLSGALTVLTRLPSFIITLSMMNIAVGMARYLTRSESVRSPQLLVNLGNNGLPLGPESTFPYIAMLAAVVLLIGHVVLQHTRFGRYVYMTGGNREAARLAGVRTRSVVVACLGISAFTAGLGGLVNAGRLERISHDQNSDLLLNAVACVVLGGTSLFGGEGGIRQTLMGVITFQVLHYGLTQINGIDDLMRPFLLGVVLLVSLVMNGLIKRRR